MIGNEKISLRELNILLIDDDNEFIAPVLYYLKKLGYNSISTAQTLREGIDLLKEQQFDYIFLDYKLPDGNGLDVLRFLRETGRDTPCLVLTSHGCEEVAVDAMKLGAYDYANKGHISLDYVPVLIENIYERYILRKAQASHERREAAFVAFTETCTCSLQSMQDSIQSINAMLDKDSTNLPEGINNNIKNELSRIFAGVKTIEKARQSIDQQSE
jgi:DNA-binding NtrC family response regulator